MAHQWLLGGQTVGRRVRGRGEGEREGEREKERKMFYPSCPLHTAGKLSEEVALRKSLSLSKGRHLITFLYYPLLTSALLCQTPKSLHFHPRAFYFSLWLFFSLTLSL